MQSVLEFESFLVRFISEQFGLAEDYSEYIYVFFALILISVAALLGNLVVKKFILEVLRSLASKTKTKVAEYLLEESFFLRLSN